MKIFFRVHPIRKSCLLALVGLLISIVAPVRAGTSAEGTRLVADDGAADDFFGFTYPLVTDDASAELRMQLLDDFLASR